MTFLILIAVRWFAAGAVAKALVASGGSLGLVLSPWLVSRVERSGRPTSAAAAAVAAAGALIFLIMALAPAKAVFVAGSILGMACSSIILPLMTQIYQENYPGHQRGARFARTVMIRIGTAAVFGLLGGLLLSETSRVEFPGGGFAGRIGHFPWLLAGFAGAFAFSSYCLARIPSRPLTASGGGTHPFRALRFFRDDRLFRQTLIGWMFLGFANLMMLPLRVEFLANPRYGVAWHGAALSAGVIAILTGVLPNAVRLLLNPLWGHLFDRMNFFVLRITLNLGFVLGILCFFSSGEAGGLVTGAVFYGISMAGGDVAWSLWVTKFAPPERVADYMAVHTFLTGVRGVVAPAAAFILAGYLPLDVMGWICAGMIIVGTLFMVPEIKHGRKSRPGAALVEEISE